MDPQFRSSFIPKKNISGVVDKTKKQRIPENLLSYLSAGAFVIALVVSLASFGYQLFLENRLNAKGVELEMLRNTIEQEKIAEFQALDSKIRAARELLRNHVSMTNLFEYFEANTLPNVQFRSFDQEIGQDGSLLTTKLNGVAGDYATLALQSNIFNQGSVLSQITFSDISLDSFGRVLFSLKAEVNKDSLLYF